MPRRKGSRNKIPAKTNRYNPNHKKSKFITAALLEEVYNHLKTDGRRSFPAIKELYRRKYKDNFFCLMDFEPVWVRLLNRITATYGSNPYTEMNRALRKPPKESVEPTNKVYRRNLKNPPVQ